MVKSTFFEKSSENIWWFQKKAVPLHTQFRKHPNCTNKNALVAQLVEHLTLNQGVQGSTPCRRTKATIKVAFFHTHS